MEQQPNKPTRILRLNDVKEKTGLSRSSIYAFVKEGKFPKPISLGDRAVGWIESEIELFLLKRADMRG